MVMTEENLYSRVMKKREVAELEDYILHSEKYEEEAILAAIWELGHRGIAIPGMDTLELSIGQKLLTAQGAGQQDTPVDREPYLVDKLAPKLFDPNSVLVFGALFSVLGGAILMALNLKEIGKTKQISLVVGLALIFSILQSSLLTYIQVTHPLVTTLLSLLGMAILHLLIWKRQVTNAIAFKSRSMWVPVLIAVGVGILAYYSLQHLGILEELGLALPK
jgi:hypothetical protein